MSQTLRKKNRGKSLYLYFVTQIASSTGKTSIAEPTTEFAKFQNQDQWCKYDNMY